MLPIDAQCRDAPGPWLGTLAWRRSSRCRGPTGPVLAESQRVHCLLRSLGGGHRRAEAALLRRSPAGQIGGALVAKSHQNRLPMVAPAASNYSIGRARGGRCSASRVLAGGLADQCHGRRAVSRVARWSVAAACRHGARILHDPPMVRVQGWERHGPPPRDASLATSGPQTPQVDRNASAGKNRAARAAG